MSANPFKKHDAAGEEIAEGAHFLEYSEALRAVLLHARPHLLGAVH